MATDTIKEVNILHVEDEEACVKLISKYLLSNKYTNFNIVRTCNLNESLIYLEDECFLENKPEFDVILLDLNLPDSCGIETYEKIRDRCNDTPIVILSGHEDLAIRCVSMGAQDYLIKPNFTMDMLSRSLRYAIERDRLMKEKIHIENRYSAVINFIPLGIHNYVLKDGDIILDSYNPAADKILKLDHSKLIGTKFVEAFPGMKKSKVEEIYKDLAIGKKKLFKEIREYEDDRIPLSFFRINAFSTEINSLTVSFEDITEAIKNEINYRHIIEATNAGIFEIDYLQCRFRYVNEKFCKMTGYTKGELLSLNINKLLTKGSLAIWIEKVNELKKGTYIDKTLEYEFVTKSGANKWYLLTAEYIESRSGKVIGANVVAIDITEQKRLKEVINKKELYLFNELEKRIHQWRLEVDSDLKIDFENKKT